MGTPQKFPAFSSETNNSAAAKLSASEHGNEDSICGRERLKKHRQEVAGHVVIPESWGHENFLKDWIDCSSFDKLLAPDGISSARQSLAAQGRQKPTSNSQRFRIASRSSISTPL